MLSPWTDSAAFPTLASLMFLIEAIEGPVSLDGIEILPEPVDEPEKEPDAGKPPARLTPVEAVRRVVRPNVPRQELFDAILATRWPRKTTAASEAGTAAKPDAVDADDAEAVAEEAAEEDDGLGKAEDFLQPAAPEK